MMVADSCSFFDIHIGENDICDKTISRLDAVIDAYHLEELNLNVVAGYQYRVAAYSSLNENNEQALMRLEKYAKIVCDMMDKGMLHGDSYFSKLDKWFEKLDLGTQMPRSKKLVMKSARENLNNPLFDKIRDRKEFKRIEKMLDEQ